MEHTPDAVAEALASGEAEQVNRVIDEVENMDLEERAALFDDCFEVCREFYESDDGYQRQSAIRLAAALYPRLAYRAVGAEFTDETLPGEYTVDATASHRSRLRELYLEALVDDDGRVRRAAAKAIKELGLTAKMIDADDELQSMLETLDSLAAQHSESKAKHIEQAAENVAVHAPTRSWVRPEGRQTAGTYRQSSPAAQSGVTESMGRLERYRWYREVGQELSTKLLRECTDREAIMESARLLGIDREGDEIHYETQAHMPVHYEFLLNEYRQDGQTAVERYYHQDRWESEIERTILAALLDADTSLFKITAIDETEKQLLVTDLLNDGADRKVTDVNLSTTAEPGVLLFFRLVPHEEFNMTSGISFPFPEEEADRLRREYRTRAGESDAHPESVQRFTAFFDLYRDYGIHIQYL